MRTKRRKPVVGKILKRKGPWCGLITSTQVPHKLPCSSLEPNYTAPDCMR